MSLLGRLRRGSDAVVSDAWLVVGLGNPGPRFAGTRHNVGYRVGELLVARMGASYRAHKSRRADVVEGRLGTLGVTSVRAVVARPRSYMNEVGGPVRTLFDFYRISLDHLVVVHDELDLPVGAVRVKQGGGDNGHNGLKSVRAAVGSGDFIRVRLGIGRPSLGLSPAEYVLQPFAAPERREVEDVIDTAANAVTSVVLRGISMTQNEMHSQRRSPRR